MGLTPILTFSAFLDLPHSQTYCFAMEFSPEKLKTKRTGYRQPIAPSLFVIFARDSNEAVIFRRGPLAWYHVIRWDTLTDTFHPGAWFRGRIYPEKCDLSPNGELLLCFMHQGRKLGTSYKDSWNAVSRNPWLEAIWLLPQGTTYGGGGRFIDDRTVVIRQFPGLTFNAHPNHLGVGLEVIEEGVPGTIALQTSSEEVPEADWSGRDQSGRLIFTSGGQLFFRDDLFGEDVCLKDFQKCSPKPVAAPEWASAPLAPLKRKRDRSRPAKKVKSKS